MVPSGGALIRSETRGVAPHLELPSVPRRAIRGDVACSQGYAREERALLRSRERIQGKRTCFLTLPQKLVKPPTRVATSSSSPRGFTGSAIAAPLELADVVVCELCESGAVPPEAVGAVVVAEAGVVERGGVETNPPS